MGVYVLTLGCYEICSNAHGMQISVKSFFQTNTKKWCSWVIYFLGTSELFIPTNDLLMFHSLPPKFSPVFDVLLYLKQF